MQRIHLLWVVLIAMGAVVSVSAKKQADEDKAKDAAPAMNVQINEAAVRLSPSFLGELAATLNYGDGVGVLEEQEDWRRVETEAQAVTGWIHASALTKKAINLEAGETDENVDANREDLALGGRGVFTQEVEDHFREEHDELEAAYKLLDQLVSDPARRASREEMIRFLREGELKARPGGVY